MSYHNCRELCVLIIDAIAFCRDVLGEGGLSSKRRQQRNAGAHDDLPRSDSPTRSTISSTGCISSCKVAVEVAIRCEDIPFSTPVRST